MKERPILFSGPMVIALLAGTKTQTRRTVAPRHDWHVDEVPDRAGVWREWPVFEAYVYAEPDTVEVPCPHGVVGDRLWVRETFGYDAHDDRLVFHADHPGAKENRSEGPEVWRWKPSIFMPRSASRITLEVADVRVERLKDISESDAIAEGVTRLDGSRGPNKFTVDWDLGSLSAPKARGVYEMLWETINGAGSWALDPWVWVIEFRKVAQ